MGKISLSPYEAYKIQRVAQQYRDNPEVVWATLAEMGDEYAAVPANMQGSWR